MKFEFGEKVRVKATIIRMRGPLPEDDDTTNNQGKNYRYWKKYEDVDYEAIFLGYRTLRNGRSEWDVYDEDSACWYFDTDQYIPGALVCRKGFNPIKVFLEHIEPICCGQVDSDGGVCNLKVDHKEDHNFQ